MEDKYVQFSCSLEKYTLKEFLEQISIFMGNEEDNTDNKVKLMTIHQAKGLEFEYVFVVGLEEEFYPCYLCTGSDGEIEEERRILYVAITRAKRNCYLSYANNRLIGDKESKRTVSRFISDINQSDLIEIYYSPSFKEYLKKNKALDRRNNNEHKRSKSQNNNKKGIKAINLIKIKNKNKTESKEKRLKKNQKSMKKK